MERTEIAKAFKIRSSGTSNIMGVKGLGKTGQSYIEQWVKEYLYKRRPEIKSKYLTKGNVQEEEGFTLMATELNLGMVYKNTELFENDYMKGTPDLIVNGVVYDNKCSWSLDTFPMFEKEVPNKDYWWQLQSYMELTGCDKSVLVYTLIDADEFEIERQIKWESNPEKIYKVINEMVYTKDYFNNLVDRFCPTAISDYFIEIPEDKRIKTFEIEKDKKSIMEIEYRVDECRTFIHNLTT